MSHKVLKLIISLDRGEKRYINLQMQLEKNKSFAILYGHILKQKKYDEEKAAIFLQKQGYKMKIDMVYHYLYKKIMQFLRSYHHNKIDSSDFFEHLLNAKIFKLKELPKFFEYEKKKAIQAALRNESFHEHIQILNLNYHLVIKGIEESKSLIKMHEQNILLLERQIKKEKITILLVELYHYIFGCQGIKEEGEKLVKELEAIDISTFPSNFQLRYYIHMQWYYQNTSPKSPKIPFFYEKTLQLFKENKELNAGRMEFFRAHHNYFMYLCHIEKPEKALLLLNEYADQKTFFTTYNIPSSDRNIGDHAYFFIYSLIEIYVTKDVSLPTQQVITQIKKDYFPLIKKGFSESIFDSIYCIICYWIFNRKEYEYLYDFVEEYFLNYPHSESRYYLSLLHTFHLVGLYEVQHRYFDQQLEKKVYWFNKSNDFDKNPYIKLIFSLFRRLNKRIQPQHQLTLLEEYLPKFQEFDGWEGINLTHWISHKIEEVKGKIEG